ncbi:MAG TPA: hypothetical protein VN619_13060 [Lacisediminihabitans sp.]|jgi:hypothetical protein|nr:hypothetical protein [Lacisediminihabitans sp.]HXD62843.1 hypothetical protein [Lacisediminihabitans sp.]
MSSAADTVDLLGAGSVALITIVVIFVGLVGTGFAILFRRRGRVNEGAEPRALAKRASVLLVRVDDAVRNGADELGFAIAQFGEEGTREFAAVLTEARAKLTEAFMLQQRLDDATPDSPSQSRDWNARIVHLCEAAQSALEQQERAFRERRASEKDAPASLAAVREAIAATSARLPASATALAALGRRYSPAAVATVSDSVDEAKALLDAASGAADAAESRIADTAGPVAESIRSAQQDVARAGQALDGIDRLASTLGELSARLEKLVGVARDDLAEARAVRDTPPDPATGAAVNEAISRVEAVLTGLGVPSSVGDPAAGIQSLEAALASLDLALGTARNQAQRLEHARTALAGALLTARSQLATTGDYINARRGGVGAEARTRLAEAQRLLTIAEAESDPVTALDTARSSATYSRDADALARYDAMKR